jgi:glycerophosphoryl diester phosphodiesterase
MTAGAPSKTAGAAEGPTLASKLGIDEDFLKQTNMVPKVIGHRGALYDQPENTVPSLEAAAGHGAEAVEIDVFRLKCGRLAVFHGDGSDATPGGLLSYCGVDGSIVNLTAAEARGLRFRGGAHCCPSETLDGAGIPFLEEFLQHAKDLGIEVKIELKGSRTEEPVIEMVEAMGMIDMVTFSSFHHERIHKVRRLRPQLHSDGSHVYRTGALFAEVPPDFIERAKTVDATEVHLRYDTCTKERVDAIHDAGFDSMSWFRGPHNMRRDIDHFSDVEDEDEALYGMVALSGVQAMCVNRPDRLYRMISNMESSLSGSDESSDASIGSEDEDEGKSD